jgi:hypothetical protein
MDHNKFILGLFNNPDLGGFKSRPAVAVLDNTSLDFPSSPSINIDSVNLERYDRVLFTALSDSNLNNRIYKVVKDRDSDNLSFILEKDGQSINGSPVERDLVYVRAGAYEGTLWSYNGSNWIQIELDFSTFDDFKKDGSIIATGNFNLDGNKIVNLGSPILNQDAVNKLYIDSSINGLNINYLKRDGTNSPSADINFNKFKVNTLSGLLFDNISPYGNIGSATNYTQVGSPYKLFVKNSVMIGNVSVDYLGPTAFLTLVKDNTLGIFTNKGPTVSCRNYGGNPATSVGGGGLTCAAARGSITTLIPLQQNDVLGYLQGWGEADGNRLIAEIRLKTNEQYSTIPNSPVGGKIVFIIQPTGEAPIHNSSLWNARENFAFYGNGTVTGFPDLILDSLGAIKLNKTLNANTHLISNVLDPVSPQDAATKKYVDDHSIISLSKFEIFPTDRSYTIEEYAMFSYDIKKLVVSLTSGTCNLTIKINGTNITGLSSIGCSSSQQNVDSTATYSVAVGDKVTAVVSSSSSPTDLSFTLKGIRL